MRSTPHEKPIEMLAKVSSLMRKLHGEGALMPIGPDGETLLLQLPKNTLSPFL